MGTQIRREIFRTLRMNAKSMIRRWEKVFNECAKTKRRRAHRNINREEMKHMNSQEVLPFIKGKDILHELFHLQDDDKENIPPVPIIDSQTQVIPHPLQDFNMNSMLEDMGSLSEPIPMQDSVMDSLVKDMDSLLEPITFDSLVEGMDSLIEQIPVQDVNTDSLLEDMDSLLEPIMSEDMDSLSEPIMLEDMDSLLEPIVVEDKDSLLEPIDSLLEPIAVFTLQN